MNKVIQLRGNCGSGKSTAVREFMALLPHEKQVIDISGQKGKKEAEVYGNTAILGRYKDKECACGCDVLKNREDVLEGLQNLLNLGFETIVFEGLIYSTTFKLAKTVEGMCKERGYQYIPVFIDRDFDQATEYVFTRNGGKPIKVNKNFEKYIRCKTSFEKLLRSGVKGVRIDATSKPRGWLGEQIARIAAEAN